MFFGYKEDINLVTWWNEKKIILDLKRYASIKINNALIAMHFGGEYQRVWISYWEQTTEVDNREQRHSTFLLSFTISQLAQLKQNYG